MIAQLKINKFNAYYCELWLDWDTWYAVHSHDSKVIQCTTLKCKTNETKLPKQIPTFYTFVHKHIVNFPLVWFAYRSTKMCQCLYTLFPIFISSKSRIQPGGNSVHPSPANTASDSYKTCNSKSSNNDIFHISSVLDCAASGSCSHCCSILYSECNLQHNSSNLLW